MDGRTIRLERLMQQQNAVVIAFDHGLFDGPIAGMEDLPATAGKINPAVDAVLLAPGMLRHCAACFAGRKKPLAMVRLNWNTVYCFGFGYRDAVSVPSYDVEDALREGMDIALVSLTLQTGSEAQDAANVQVFSSLVNRCHRLGIPVVGEYFPTEHEKMTPQQLCDSVRTGSRIVCELGADAVKTFHTTDFKPTAHGCASPILVLGAEKLPTQLDALNLAASGLADHARGVVFGRNAIQVPDPQAFQAALCDVVHKNVSPEQACKNHQLSDA